MNEPAALRRRVSACRRVVIKVGSSLLVEAGAGRVRRDWLASLSADIAAIAARGSAVIVVSSGAIALGRGALGLPRRALKLEEAQAAASVGQVALARAWSECLQGQGLTAAQVLLTLGDTEERRRYLNARATLGTLLKLNAVPVINENDTVATTEIRYGDNDRLAARVAAMTGADGLVQHANRGSHQPGSTGDEAISEIRRGRFSHGRRPVCGSGRTVGMRERKRRRFHGNRRREPTDGRHDGAGPCQGGARRRSTGGP